MIHKSDTRRQAHQDIQPRKPTLRKMAVDLLRDHGPLTADEAAVLAGVSPFAMRPRFTELAKDKVIEDTGVRRPSSQGKPSAVCQLNIQLEQGDMMADLFPPLATR